MRRSILSKLADAWAGAPARFARKPEKGDELGTIRISVSESGWQATLQFPNEPPQTTAESWIDANVPVTTVEAVRRAVRAISRAQRERIGSVRLAVVDPAIFIIDNRSARIRSPDPAVIAEVGCQELGVDAVLYGFVPFGHSSEYEVPRGAYAFIALDHAREYLVALDTLAPCLVELVPAPLLELAGAQTDAFATFELRSSGTTLLLADPETGTVLSREFACGRSDFAAALVEATSVSPREAADGLQRRVCFSPETGWPGASIAMTATERAFSKLLGSLKTELGDWLEHFVHHRLANAPTRVLVKGEADRVRGLSEWIARVIGVRAQNGIDLHRRFTEAPEVVSRNMLQTAPSGMLTIGKIDYRFVDGRFRSNQSHPAKPASRTGATRPGLVSPKHMLAMIQDRKLTLPAGIVLALGAAIFVLLGELASPLEQASEALAAAQAEDSAVRAALLRGARSGAASASEPALDWSAKLVTIAQALPNDIRVLKITVSGADPAVDDKLVLEGEAVASDRNLAEISGVIDHLSGSAAFMHDVGAINFGGIDVGASSAGDLLRFTINVSLANGAGRSGQPVPPGR